jgi:catechol 2,3-dioxygenase-like lactoylglutathione lyase family enzyme
MTRPKPPGPVPHWLRLAGLACLLSLGALAQAATAAGPARLLSILAATVTTPDINRSITLYQEALDYRLIERGAVPRPLAKSWGAPAMAGREQAVLAPASGEAVYLRLVAGSPVPRYAPLTSPGWNAVELLVADPDRVSRRLEGTAFTRLGAPDFLAPGSTIRATQFSGPAGEVFYFTADQGPRETSTLAGARSAVDRPFILVLAGNDIGPLAAFYREQFGLPEAFRTHMPVPILARAQGRDEARNYPLALLRLRAFSHSLELDGYGDLPPRPSVAGELPPGVALATFLVDDLDALGDLPTLGPAAAHAVAPYGGRRSVTFRGPAGELVELVEVRAPAD